MSYVHQKMLQSVIGALFMVAAVSAVRLGSGGIAATPPRRALGGAFAGALDGRGAAAEGRPTAAAASPELAWLRLESHRLADARANVQRFLKERGIVLDREPETQSDDVAKASSLTSRWRPRIVLSAEDNDIHCRVGLDRVPIGKKAIAPCKCKGTNEWIAFSTLNSLRRRDPSQWEGRCRTCLSPLDLSPVYEHGGLAGNLLAASLDHPAALRGAAALAILSTVRALRAGDHLKSFLTSAWLWSKYPSWAEVAHLPLPLRLLALRYLAGQLGGALLATEAAVRDALADLETSIVEPRLPTIN